MAQWTIVKGARRVTPEADSEIDEAWRYTLERDSDEREVRVEVTASVAASDRATLPDEVRQALATRGRSALTKFLDDDEPPTRLAITSTGIDASYASS